MSTNAGLVIAFGIALVLLLLFGGGAMTGTTMSGGMMGNGSMGGVSLGVFRHAPWIEMMGAGMAAMSTPPRVVGHS